MEIWVSKSSVNWIAMTHFLAVNSNAMIKMAVRGQLWNWQLETQLRMLVSLPSSRANLECPFHYLLRRCSVHFLGHSIHGLNYPGYAVTGGLWAAVSPFFFTTHLKKKTNVQQDLQTFLHDNGKGRRMAQLKGPIFSKMSPCLEDHPTLYRCFVQV